MTTESVQGSPGVDPRSAHYWAALHLVAAVTGASVEEIVGETRGDRRAALARQLVATLVHVEAPEGQAQSLSDIARRVGRDRSSISHAIHAIEDDRSDEDVDAAVSKLGDLAKKLVDLHAQVAQYLGAVRGIVEAASDQSDP